MTTASIRQRAYRLIETGRLGYPPGRWFDGILALITLVNVAGVIWGTEPGVTLRWGAILAGIELVAVIAFSLEYLLRLWVCVEHPLGRYAHPLSGRLRYAVTPLALLDLLVILPAYLDVFLPIKDSVVDVLTVLRIVKLIRFTSAYETIATVVAHERRTLLGAATILLCILVVVATLAYEFEHEGQPDKFGSIASGMYWAIVTLTTVGYGDITPLTSVGRVLSGITMVLGILTMALPAGIIASGFIQDLRRIDTAAAWVALARAQPFRHLGITDIALIAERLMPQRVPAGMIITRAGEWAHSMFVVTTGEVELRGEGWTRVLGKGDVFDVEAILGPIQRPATARALTVSDLLVLDVKHFRALLQASPSLAMALPPLRRDPP